MGSTLSYLIYHFVYSIKNRENLIHSFEEELYKYTTGIITGEGGSLITIGGMPDHMHIYSCEAFTSAQHFRGTSENKRKYLEKDQ